MDARPFIVVSGLPASGKTTLATRLADQLGLPLLDKDDILEVLFEGRRSVDLDARQQLSRMSDDVLTRIAAASQGAVLVSFWRHESDEGQSGTPIAWLRALSGSLIEVHCACSPEIAGRRFRDRRRNPAHNDTSRLPVLAAQLRRLADRGPLGIGTTITVRTDAAYDFDLVLKDVRQLLGIG